MRTDWALKRNPFSTQLDLFFRADLRGLEGWSNQICLTRGQSSLSNEAQQLDDMGVRGSAQIVQGESNKRRVDRGKQTSLSGNRSRTRK